MPLDHNEANGNEANAVNNNENEVNQGGFRIDLQNILQEVHDNRDEGFFGHDSIQLEDLKKQISDRKSLVFYNAAGENISDQIDLHPEDLSQVCYIARTSVLSENPETFEPKLTTELLHLRNDEGILVINRRSLSEMGNDAENREIEKKLRMTSIRTTRKLCRTIRNCVRTQRKSWLLLRLVIKDSLSRKPGRRRMIVNYSFIKR